MGKSMGFGKQAWKVKLFGCSGVVGAASDDDALDLMDRADKGAGGNRRGEACMRGVEGAFIILRGELKAADTLDFPVGVYGLGLSEEKLQARVVGVLVLRLPKESSIDDDDPFHIVICGRGILLQFVGMGRLSSE